MNSGEVSKSQFKAKALQFFREVKTTEEAIIVTDYGKPVIEICPYREKSTNSFDKLMGSVTKHIDPTESLAGTD